VLILLKGEVTKLHQVNMIKNNSKIIRS